MLRKMLRRKPIGHTHSHAPLRRSLTTADLTLMGIGAIIGAGVFILTGIAAATKAGPAIILSYCFAGLASLFTALAYAELASSIGGTGSAYSYAYIAFGELIAWIIGWNLILEYMMGVSTIAIGWSGYVANLFQALKINLPASITKNPFDGGIINLLASGIIVIISLLLCIGTKVSARFNAIVVLVKLLAIGIFIVVASSHVKISNWEDFLPFGWPGVMQGAALVFFAYVGFDALSTAVEEAIDPQYSVPIGIIISLIICTLIYIVVAALLTGIVPYKLLNVKSPVSEALLIIGHHTAAGFIAIGAIAGLTTGMLVGYFALSRILLAMARDGLLPKSIAAIHPKTHSPIKINLIAGAIIAIVSGITPISHLAELVSIGSLAAFIFVCSCTVIFRHTHPDLHRPFKLPFSPLIPFLGIISCSYLMLNLPSITWWRFLIWTMTGLIIYFVYGRRHSTILPE